MLFPALFIMSWAPSRHICRQGCQHCLRLQLYARGCTDRPLPAVVQIDPRCIRSWRTITMALLVGDSMPQTLPNDLQFVEQARDRTPKLNMSVNPSGHRNNFVKNVSVLSKAVIFCNGNGRRSSRGLVMVRGATTKEKPKKHYPGESKGFVEEMRFVAMRLHTKDTTKEGEKEPDAQPIGSWEPTIEGYLRFLVDSKLVYDTLETIVERATYPAYAEFKNTGLERSEKLAKDLEWFKQQGHVIPEPGSPGISYAKYLEELAEKDPPAFICHFYNIYFAHTAGGRMIGRKVAEKILDGRELEFYKWDGDLPELLRHVKEKLNKVAEGWSRQEKNRCLEETAKSFKYSGKILRLIIS